MNKALAARGNHAGTSILEVGRGGQSPTFLKVGVDRLVISTNLLRLDRQMSGKGDLPPVVGVKRYDTRCYFNVRSKADMSQL